MSWTLDIPVAIPSANVIKRALYGGNRWAYTKIRKDFAWAVVASAHGVPRATGHRRVHVVRVMGPRAKRYDHDNLVAGCKPLLDELVTSGLLLDDDDARASVTYGQERGDHNATRIEIAEAA